MPVGLIKIAPAIFHSSAKVAESLNTILMLGIINTDSVEWGQLLNQMTNWSRLKGTAMGSHGAQQTFKLMEKIARAMQSIINEEHFTFHPCVRLITALIRYYDIGKTIDDDIKALLLIYGSIGYAMFSLLSDRVGGRAEDGPSFLEGAGSSNLMDFFCTVSYLL